MLIEGVVIFLMPMYVVDVVVYNMYFMFCLTCVNIPVYFDVCGVFEGIECVSFFVRVWYPL